MDAIKALIRDVPDFPKQGVVFKDITPVLHDAHAFKQMIDACAQVVQKYSIDTIVSIESRGFILGAALAYACGVGFVPVRKKGKLPAATIARTYALEYGTDTLEMHKDGLRPGSNVLVIDDVLATGGTMGCVVSMVEELDASVQAILFLIELSFLHGRETLSGYDVHALITY